MSKLKLAVAGSKGSFSHQAADLFATSQGLGDVELVYALDSEGVFQALLNGEADQGIMPIYNPTGGLVQMTLDAMGKHKFTIEATFDMPVMQCLLALPSVRQDEIRGVYSHPQALAQCQQYLDTQLSDAVPENYSDTAQAAADLAAGKLPTISAVIAPEICAELYGLRVVQKGIQDDEQNQTHFIVCKLA